MYKVLAKILTNRLNVVISSVLSKTKFAFFMRIEILDEILIANEVQKMKKGLLFKLILRRSITQWSKSI